jgi:HEAT repeat-containing protein 5
LALINLKIYDPCWLQIIHAVATLIELKSEDIFGALDSKNNVTGDSTLASLAQSNYRDEPVAFFFVIYGLCFQTLLKMINKDDSKAKRTIPAVLDALKRFLRPSISGNAMYKGFVFSETTDLLDRLVLMESSDVQLTVIHIAASLAKFHPNGMHAQNNGR